MLGRYSNLITGPGAVMLGMVPEPGACLAIISLAAVALVRRGALNHEGHEEHEGKVSS